MPHQPQSKHLFNHGNFFDNKLFASRMRAAARIGGEHIGERGGRIGGIAADSPKDHASSLIMHHL